MDEKSEAANHGGGYSCLWPSNAEKYDPSSPGLSTSSISFCRSDTSLC